MDTKLLIEVYGLIKRYGDFSKVPNMNSFEVGKGIDEMQTRLLNFQKRSQQSALEGVCEILTQMQKDLTSSLLKMSQEASDSIYECHIEKFIDQKLPLRGPEDDIKQAFADFWSDERSKAFKEFQDTHGLQEEPFRELVSQMLFSGKPPLADDVMRAMKEKPSLLQRRKVVERILAGVNDLVEIFDENVGELEE